MKNISRHVGTLANLQRLPSSVNGNPRWAFTVNGTYARTAVDSAHGYRIDNYRGQRVVVTIGTYYGVPTLHSIRKADDGVTA
jgi:hypothetical protein